MKVIHLLNKIYNKEHLPHRIKIGNAILTLNKYNTNYLLEDSNEYYGDELIHWFDLDDEVEILDVIYFKDIDYFNKEDNLLHISNTLENILYVLERIEKKIYEED